MKKFLIFLVALVASLNAAAQDVIVKNDNSTILCRIVEVNNNEVVYLKWLDLNGPRYVMDRSLIANINYEDGRQDKLNQQTSNAYAPGNQQTGEWKYNDQALLAMDIPRNYTQKAKKLRIIGWTVGGVCVAGGVGLIFAHGSYFNDAYSGFYISGGILILGGIATTTTCLFKAHQLEKKARTISFAPVFQKEFNLGNGKSLCAGVDVIRDSQYKQTTLGLGLQYNF